MIEKKAIETLKQLRLDYEEFYEEHNNEVTQAYDMAIASLKTDDAYQLEFENRDCVEVVRCKDCKHYMGNSCEWHNGFKPPINWFCADGERE